MESTDVITKGTNGMDVLDLVRRMPQSRMPE